MDIKSLEAAIERAWEDRTNLSPSTQGEARTAVNAALDLAAFQSEVEAGIDKMVKAGGVSNAVDVTCRLPSSMT